MNDGLRRAKNRDRAILAAAVLALSALILYGVLSPSPEEAEFEGLKTSILSRRPGGMSRDERAEFRKTIEALPPETRRRLFREVARERIREMRARTAGMSDEEVAVEINKMTLRIREGFAKLSPERKKMIKERMESEEFKTAVREGMEFYYQEFSAKERERLDPMVYEWLKGVNSL